MRFILLFGLLGTAGLAFLFLSSVVQGWSILIDQTFSLVSSDHTTSLAVNGWQAITITFILLGGMAWYKMNSLSRQQKTVQAN